MADSQSWIRVGAAVFGTTEGLNLKGDGMLDRPNLDLLRAVDFDNLHLREGEICWFGVPGRITDVNRITFPAWFIGQVTLAADYRSRLGVAGVGVLAMATRENERLDSEAFADVEKRVRHSSSQLVKNHIDPGTKQVTLSGFETTIPKIDPKFRKAAQSPQFPQNRPRVVRVPGDWRVWIEPSRLLESMTIQFGQYGFVVVDSDAIHRRPDFELDRKGVEGYRVALLKPDRDALVDAHTRWKDSNDALDLAERREHQAVKARKAAGNALHESEAARDQAEAQFRQRCEALGLNADDYLPDLSYEPSTTRPESKPVVFAEQRSGPRPAGQDGQRTSAQPQGRGGQTGIGHGPRNVHLGPSGALGGKSHSSGGGTGGGNDSSSTWVPFILFMLLLFAFVFFIVVAFSGLVFGGSGGRDTSGAKQPQSRSAALGEARTRLKGCQRVADPIERAADDIKYCDDREDEDCHEENFEAVEKVQEGIAETSACLDKIELLGLRKGGQIEETCSIQRVKNYNPGNLGFAGDAAEVVECYVNEVNDLEVR